MFKNCLLGALLALLSTAVQAHVLHLRAELSGANEYDAATNTLGVGDPDGWGVAHLFIGDDDVIEWTIEFHNLSTLTGAHVHTGMFAQNGPVLIPFTVPPGTPGDGVLSGTINSFANAHDFFAPNPSAFYVNVHSTQFPAGAIRGQLVAVPEPETYAMLGLGLGALALARRRKATAA